MLPMVIGAIPKRARRLAADLILKARRGPKGPAAGPRIGEAELRERQRRYTDWAPRPSISLQQLAAAIKPEHVGAKALVRRPNRAGVHTVFAGTSSSVVA